MAETTGTFRSVIIGRDRDCFLCRLVSGVGLFGAGLYVHHHSKKVQDGRAHAAMFVIASALLGLGTARVFGVMPFSSEKALNEE